MPGPDGARNAAKTNVKRSRKGCHTCKKLKIKCDEIKPRCSYCVKSNHECDYTLKLTWGGRPYKDVNKRKHVFNITTNPTNPISKKRGATSVQFAADKKSKPSRLRVQSSPSNSPNFIDHPIKRENSVSTSLENPSTAATSPHVELLSSPPAFTTPNGVSLLSYDEDDRLPLAIGLGSHGMSLNTEILLASMLESELLLSSRSENMHPPTMAHSVSLPLMENTDFPVYVRAPKKALTPSSFHQSTDSLKKEKPLESPLSILANITEFTQGVESLSDAFEKISDGKQGANDLFSNFLSGIEERRGNTPIPDSIQLSEIRAEDLMDAEDNEFLSDYSTDLAKIEAYSPTPRSSLLNEFQSSIMMFNKRIDSHKLLELDDEDEQDISSIPLDYENSPQSALTPRSDPNYYFESIPPLLLPLPEILNQVPHYRQLMHFWLEVASTNLVPAPSHIYKENPFKVLLPQMAMEYPAVLTTLLAFAATWMATISGKDQPVDILNQLVARSCKALVKMLKDKELATSDGALATVLLFSCYEGIVTHDFDRHRAHTIGARQIIMARRAKQRIKASPEASSPESISLTSSTRSNVGTESDVAFFLMRWFVYIDVIGALSATKKSTDYLAHQEELSTYEPAESVNNMNTFDSATTSDPKRDIDHILGFDVKILPHLTDIVCLIRRANAYSSQPGADSTKIPISIITKALEVKELMTRAYEQGEARRQQRLDELSSNHSGDISFSKQQKYKKLIKQDKVLRCTNKLFSDMGLLNLYRRVLKIPRQSSIIQDLANGMGQILELVIESKSSAEICTIFCNFCAACETLDDHYRTFYFDRFTKLTEMGSVSAMKSLQIMQRCWATGEDWIQAATKLEIDLTLL